MAVQTLAIVENSKADLKKKLAAEEQARKSVDLALEGVERQAESQRKLTRETNDQLAASKEQVGTLRKQLEETQRLRDQAEKARAEAENAKAEAERVRHEAEQHGYVVGVAETEDALRAEVLAVCRAYCAQTWEEALNRTGIDDSSELRRLENIFFPPAIQAPSSTSGQKESDWIELYNYFISIIIIIIIIIIKLSIRTTPPQTILNFNSASKFKQTIEIRRLK